MHEATSARRAEEYEAAGFTDVKAILGGVDAWRGAGFPMARGDATVR